MKSTTDSYRWFYRSEMGGNTSPKVLITAIIWIAVLSNGATTIEGCNVDKIRECVSHLDGYSMGEMCKAIDETKSCIKQALTGCPPEIRNSFEAAMEQHVTLRLCDEAAKNESMETAQHCSFPRSWHGTWLQIQTGDNIEVRQHQLSHVGHCVDYWGDKYLLHNQIAGCYTCVSFNVQHEFLMQYNQGLCEETRPEACGIPDSLLHTMVKESTDSVSTRPITDDCDVTKLGKCMSTVNWLKITSNDTLCQWSRALVTCLNKLRGCTNRKYDILNNIKMQRDIIGCGLGPETTDPEFAGEENVNVTVTVGSIAVLPCRVNFLGSHEVAWMGPFSKVITLAPRMFTDDRRISIRRPYPRDWNLHLRDVRYRDQGAYRCQINTTPIKVKTINLVVRGSAPETNDTHFAGEENVTVTVTAGFTAVLPCRINFLGSRKVVWTDQWSTLLTYTDQRIIDDDRLSIKRPYPRDWNLHLRDVKYGDQGVYNCQINTKPMKIKTINLVVRGSIITTTENPSTTLSEGCDMTQYGDCLSNFRQPSDYSKDAICKWSQELSDCIDKLGGCESRAISVESIRQQRHLIGCESFSTTTPIPTTTLSGACDTVQFGYCTTGIPPPDIQDLDTMCEWNLEVIDCYNRLVGCESLSKGILENYRKRRRTIGCDSTISSTQIPSTTTSEGCDVTQLGYCMSQFQQPNDYSIDTLCKWSQEVLDCFDKLVGCELRTEGIVNRFRQQRHSIGCGDDPASSTTWSSWSHRPTDFFSPSGESLWSHRPTEIVSPTGGSQPRTTPGPVRVISRKCVEEQNTIPFNVPAGACSNKGSSCKHEMVTLSNERNILCDVGTDGGGWVVIQRRISNTDFKRDWFDYKVGFGKVNESFWMGLENIHRLCPETKPPCELRVDFSASNDTGMTSHYKRFAISGAHRQYKIEIGRFSGVNDVLMGSNHQPFTARFNPGHRSHSLRDCLTKTGAWWLDRFCSQAGQSYSLNGRMGDDGVMYSEIKVRRFSDKPK